jgi:hypothetical protein
MRLLQNRLHLIHFQAQKTSACERSEGGDSRSLENGDLIGKLRTVTGHVIDPAYLSYHREHFGAS